jgi:hypothetical protein
MPRGIAPAALIARLHADVTRFAAGAEAADDLSVLVLRWSGENNEGQTPIPAAAEMGV